METGQAGMEHEHYDVCVVGAGPAGITIALGLAEKGARVCLLEGGGTGPDARQEDTYGFRNVGAWNYPGTGRSRYLGGSSNCWGGLCSRLDPIDFDARSWIPDSGWPIALTDIEPHYEKASAILDLRMWGKRENPREFPENVGYRGPGFSPKRWNVSAPTKFGEKYGAKLRQSRSLSVFLNTSVVDVVLNDGHRTVKSLLCRLPSGGHAQLEARYFVLACGGIENPRILLNARKQQAAGVGNENGCVGRYFMDHLYFNDAAQLVLANGTNLPDGLKLAPYGFLRGGFWNLQLTPERQREKRLPNMAVRFDREEALDFTIPWGTDFGGSKKCINLSLFGELRPSRGNRIRLAAETDYLGLQKTEIEAAIPAEDSLAYKELLWELVRFLGSTGLGRVRIKNEQRNCTAGSHHMGTTRMGTDPKTSVTNRDGRLHGVQNLYCAGSSAFPTGGCTNPTLTIVALALRLTAELQSRLQSG